MRFGFVQLPVPDHHGSYTKANRPLAAGYMIAYAQRHCGRTGWQAEIIPDGLADQGGDAAIIDWALNGRFDAVLFTLYLWNRERSLFIARSIKTRRPEILTIAGGPEVTDDQAATDFPGIDILCIGEGEEFFARLVDDPMMPAVRGAHRAGDIADLAQVPDPYLAGLLPVHPGEIIHCEQMRGCPGRCAYCYYGKGRRSVRRFPPERVPGIFGLAARHEGTEIYFMDPTFNSREGLTEHLAWIARNNPTHIPVHTEVRLELIDRAVADALAAAGLQSVEAGLQSVNPRALAAVGRFSDLPAFQHGARLLMERGIEVRTGVILGLPEDTLGDFVATMDFLESARLAPTMECYILAALPGTTLRRRLGRWRMQAMTRPPYWVLSTNGMEPEDFAAAIQILERRNDMEYFPPIAPFGVASPAGFQAVIDLRAMDLAQDPDRILDPARLANSVTVFLDAPAADHARLPLWSGYLLDAAPHTCWRLVYSGNQEWPRERWQRLRRLFHYPGHYVNRSHHLCRDPQGSFSVRLFQEIDDIQSARRLLDTLREAEGVIRPKPGHTAGWKEICMHTPWVLIDPQMTAAERQMLASWYTHCPERTIDASACP
jgi:hypothetical protein